MTSILLSDDGVLRCAGRKFRAACGQGGISHDKREGDGTTPAGDWPLRYLFYRADRLPRPATRLEAVPLGRAYGWCDDPADAEHYNRFVRLPHQSRAETLWREDPLYDVIGVIGYNDAPPVPGLGSAIFLHIAAADYSPTAGCIALALPDLLALLLLVDTEPVISIGA
jgi:L,D-peptidoglycan transpeptidase YkuD (ErfK/YbiS/YcfS/YnhG family)